MNFEPLNESSEAAFSLFFMFSGCSLIVLQNPLSRLLVEYYQIPDELVIEI
jgi:hypothetical protein